MSSNSHTETQLCLQGEKSVATGEEPDPQGWVSGVAPVCLTGLGWGGGDACAHMQTTWDCEWQEDNKAKC